MQYLGYLKWLQRRYNLPTITQEALVGILTAGARETEATYRYVRFGITRCWMKRAYRIKWWWHWYSNSTYSASPTTQIQLRVLPFLNVLDDIRDGQVIIETEGEQVGQVNGLTVIDVPGHPIFMVNRLVFPVLFILAMVTLPMRKKSRACGNLHAKGMMIMQAFVGSA